MSQHEVHIVDIEGLRELLEEIGKDESVCSTEEAYTRFKRACRVAYDVTRNAIDEKELLIADLMGHAHYNTVHNSGVMAAAGCLVMQASINYLEMEQRKNPADFKTKFIFCLDTAVQSAGRGIEEEHDARTKQSAEKRSTQSPSTS